jgi:hypothetical protein
MTPRRKQLSCTPRLNIFRSYGAILQSSFDIVISIVLAFNASPPASVLGTVYVAYQISGAKKSLKTAAVYRLNNLRAGGGRVFTHRRKLSLFL